MPYIPNMNSWLIQSDQNSVKAWLYSAALRSKESGVGSFMTARIDAIVAGLQASADVFSYPLYGAGRVIKGIGMGGSGLLTWNGKKIKRGAGNVGHGLVNIIISPLRALAFSVSLFVMNFAGMVVASKVFPSYFQFPEEQQSVEVNKYIDFTYEESGMFSKKLVNMYTTVDQNDQQTVFDIIKSYLQGFLSNITVSQEINKKPVPQRCYKDFLRGWQFIIGGSKPIIEENLSDEEIKRRKINFDYKKMDISYLFEEVKNILPEKLSNKEAWAFRILSYLHQGLVGDIFVHLNRDLGKKFNPGGGFMPLFRVNIIDGHLYITIISVFSLNPKISNDKVVVQSNDPFDSRMKYMGSILKIEIPLDELEPFVSKDEKHINLNPSEKQDVSGTMKNIVVNQAVTKIYDSYAEYQKDLKNAIDWIPWKEDEKKE